jgi:hypothetical protein
MGSPRKARCSATTRGRPDDRRCRARHHPDCRVRRSPCCAATRADRRGPRRLHRAGPPSRPGGYLNGSLVLAEQLTATRCRPRRSENREDREHEQNRRYYAVVSQLLRAAADTVQGARPLSRRMGGRRAVPGRSRGNAGRDARGPTPAGGTTPATHQRRPTMNHRLSMTLLGLGPRRRHRAARGRCPQGAELGTRGQRQDLRDQRRRHRPGHLQRRHGPGQGQTSGHQRSRTGSRRSVWAVLGSPGQRHPLPDRPGRFHPCSWSPIPTQADRDVYGRPLSLPGPGRPRRPRSPATAGRCSPVLARRRRHPGLCCTTWPSPTPSRRTRGLWSACPKGAP